MTTDITELAQSLKAAAEKWQEAWGKYDKVEITIAEFIRAANQYESIVKDPANVLALVEALEKAQQERDNWRTSFDNERFRADKLKAHIDEMTEERTASINELSRIIQKEVKAKREAEKRIAEMEPINAAAEKLVRCKGRYHSEQNYRALAALFGVTTPDLRPLEHENVHYADAAEMEIAALRQRIAGLEESHAQPAVSKPWGYTSGILNPAVGMACVTPTRGKNQFPVYLDPQPAPVVDPDDNFYSWFGREWHENYQHNQYTTAAKQMLGVMAESAWRAGRRAAMLQAEPVTTANKLGNSPVIPDGSEHCPCCGKKLRRACSVEGCEGKHVAHGLCKKHYDMKRWEDPEQVRKFREAGKRYRRKTKSAAAAPQEVK